MIKVLIVVKWKVNKYLNIEEEKIKQVHYFKYLAAKMNNVNYVKIIFGL